MNKHILLVIVLLFFSCKNNTSKSFDLSIIVNEKLDSIQQINQLIIQNPITQMDHDKNDAFTRKISLYTENIIDEIINSYGKTSTDTILSILKKLDNSGYIPNELYKKLDTKDFSTKIGQKAKEDYQTYIKSIDSKLNSFKTIDLLSEELSLYRIAENDTITLRDILKYHKGYKVLDFWATWCAPCRSFNKNFKDHYSKYKNKGIEFYGIGIRIDNKKEKEKFLTAVNNDNTPWEQFIDFENKIYGAFNTNTVPFQILLDKNNQILKILSHDIDKELNEILSKHNNSN